ncbi:MBOAT family protein [Leptospira sp. 201903075]|uniref:MBOAT family O-acyltransferase n=1 Tax=Leptospira chreensis TaxID=2810035 RepID=UPI0019633435|nr:MBOAT family O-acyltransferase [Leptospira chreensis]MBM9592408.1 MBOAT family protein [Leptospira chreensis]MBM9592760.1 MBOAT family protein [Leptospira chreensis]
MIFSDFEYFVFFLFVFFTVWYLFPAIFSNQSRETRILHIFLLISSYFFYMSWDYRFGALILLSTAIDYYVGLKLSQETREKVRYYLLLFSLITNLVFILGFFKYYNFLVTSINTVTNPMFGADALPILKIILPAGISFFTFQSLSYTIDVYRKEIPAEKDFIRFALFVSFFPQLVAGPIVTARTFMPQLYSPKKLEDIEFRVAIRFFILGYFKKAVLSDMVAPTIDTIYADPSGHHAYALIIAAVLGGIQVYLDFSGYSDMAIGSAMLLGYKLPTNFNLPFLATSVSGFWRRWHMTLNSWLRDYIYIPMGGSRVISVRRKFNLWFTMFVSGVWHGAQWTFVFWGSLNGIFYVLEEIWREWFPIKKENATTKHWYDAPLWLFQNLFNSSVFFFGGVFFRSLTWENAWIHIRGIFTFQAGQIRPYMWKDFLWVLFFLYLGHAIGYLIFEKGKGKQIPASLEFALYPIVFLVLNLATPENSIPFIYFQF